MNGFGNAIAAQSEVLYGAAIGALLLLVIAFAVMIAAYRGVVRSWAARQT